MHRDAMNAVADFGIVGSGNSYADFNPLLIGVHVLPPSSVRKAPAAEMATKMRLGLVGSRRIVCRHIRRRRAARVRLCVAQPR